MIQFPKDFVFGTATAAYQIEGGWNEDGKGLSIWDVFSHRKGCIRDGTNGDVACNTYHDFQTDIDLMHEMKQDAYRFSISWSRLYPEGCGTLNPKGLDYYDRLVDALLEKGIRPFITLYHWDMPQALQADLGGFANRDTASHFADYARTVVDRLGDRVKDWITLNEPWEHAMFGHFLGEHAPGIRNPRTYFKVAHHELLGHGLAVQAMRSSRRDLNIGITLSQFPVYPSTFEPGKKDLDAVRMADLFINRFYLDGVFKGEYPQELFKRLWPIVPKIFPGDMESIRQPIDFLGVNYYSRIFAAYEWYIPFLHAWVDREPRDARYHHPELGPQGYPQGFGELARRYREEYGNPVVYITENGTVDAELHDNQRIRYMELYLDALRKAISEGADIRGYFHWSLLDNFEWSSGLSCRMGLIHVDHDTGRRTLRDSALWYRDLIAGQESRPDVTDTKSRPHDEQHETNPLASYYDNYDENGRLESKHGQVEFVTTMRFIERYLSPHARVLEIGAGTGRYSRTLANMGCSVDAVELFLHNIEIFRQNLKPGQNIRITQGNALDLSAFSANVYDITLLLGPMYHLFSEDDKRQAMSEALRVTKPGGVVFAAYCISDGSLVLSGFQRKVFDIADYIQRGKINPESFDTFSVPEDIFELVRKEDIDRLMSYFNVQRLHYVSTDLFTNYMRSTVDAMSEEEFALYLRYHFSVCERQDLVGATHHSLDVFRKGL